MFQYDGKPRKKPASSSLAPTLANPKSDATIAGPTNKPILEPCPKCGRPFLTEKITKRRGREIICSNEECGFSMQQELPEAVATT